MANPYCSCKRSPTPRSTSAGSARSSRPRSLPRTPGRRELFVQQQLCVCLSDSCFVCQSCCTNTQFVQQALFCLPSGARASGMVPLRIHCRFVQSIERNITAGHSEDRGVFFFFCFTSELATVFVRQPGANSLSTYTTQYGSLFLENASADRSPTDRMIISERSTGSGGKAGGGSVPYGQIARSVFQLVARRAEKPSLPPRPALCSALACLRCCKTHVQSTAKREQRQSLPARPSTA